MLPGESLTWPVFLELMLAVPATLLTIWAATTYLRRVRIERPAIGVFNGRDIVIVFAFIIGLPLLYVVIPLTVLLVLLGITFTSALFMGLRPILGSMRTWLVVGVAVGLNIWLARTVLGTVLGWQVFWVENSLIVIFAAVTVANLYIQGGMRLRHVASFALFLAVYDATFTFIWPVTNLLSERLLGWPFDPAAGFRVGVFNISLGLGDLLIYSMFVLVVYKGYGPARARVATLLAVVFGAVTPAVVPLLTTVFIDARTDLQVPAQAAFGPVAFIYYLWVRRHGGPERSMAEFRASADVAQPRPVSAVGPDADQPTPVRQDDRLGAVP